MHGADILCVMTCWHHVLSVDLRSCVMLCENIPESSMPSPCCRNQVSLGMAADALTSPAHPAAMPAIQMRLDEAAAVQPCKPTAGVTRSASCTQPLDGRDDDLLGEISSQPEPPPTQLAFVATQLAELPGDPPAAGPASPAAPAAAPGSATPPAQQAGDTAVGGTAATLQTAWVATEVQLQPSAQLAQNSPVDAQPAADLMPPRHDVAAPRAAAAAGAAPPAAAPPNAAVTSGVADEQLTVPGADAKQAAEQLLAQTQDLCPGEQRDKHLAAHGLEASQAPLALTAGTNTDMQLPAHGVAGSAAPQQHPAGAAPGGGLGQQQADVDVHTGPVEAAQNTSQPAAANATPGAMASQHAPVASTPATAAAAAAGTGPPAPDAAAELAELGHASKADAAATMVPFPTGVGNSEPSQTQVLRHRHGSQALRGLLTQHAPGVAAAAAPTAPEAASLPPATPHIPANAAVSRLAADMHRADEQAGLSYVDACTTVAAVAEQQAISPKVLVYNRLPLLARSQT